MSEVEENPVSPLGEEAASGEKPEGEGDSTASCPGDRNDEGDGTLAATTDSETAEAPELDGVCEEGDDQAAKELEKALREAAENYDRYLRAAAELENFRKRTARMRSETREETVRDLLLQIAPLLDNMRRALSQETGDAAAVKSGVELIVNQFQLILKGYGLDEIEAVGQPFDPNLHEAMMEVADDEHPPGTVVEEMEKGYTMRDKVVRPSRVVVSKAGVADLEDEETDG